MKITSSSNRVTIEGNIKSVNDFKEIKSCIDNVVNQHKNVDLKIVDSLSVTSSVIGYFNKLVLKDGIVLNLVAGNQQLINLLDDLNLSSTFRVRKL